MRDAGSELTSLRKFGRSTIRRTVSMPCGFIREDRRQRQGWHGPGYALETGGRVSTAVVVPRESQTTLATLALTFPKPREALRESMDPLSK